MMSHVRLVLSRVLTNSKVPAKTAFSRTKLGQEAIENVVLAGGQSLCRHPVRSLSAKWSLVAGLLVLGAGAPLWAQSVEPSEPGIVLPPVLLKIQDVSQAKIDTPLPKAGEPTLPSAGVTLPKEGGLPTEVAAAYAVPVPTEAGASAAGAKGPQSSFFSEGEIGVGSMNHIIGDVTLYKLGADPRFRIHFAHDQLDGYGFRPAGAGYFNRSDAIEGSLSSSGEGLYSLDLGASYAEKQNGLQQLSSTFNSVTHRFVAGNLGAQYLRLKPVTLDASFAAASTSVTVAGPQPLGGNEIDLNPKLGASVQFGGVQLGLSGFYGLGRTAALASGGGLGPTTQTQRAGGSLSLRAELPLSLTLKASAGLHWDDFNGLIVPFSVDLSGDYGDTVSFSLHGGQRVKTLSYAGVWRELPFLSEEGALHGSIERYGGASTQLHFGRSLAFDGGLEYTDDTAAVVPTTLAGGGTGLFAFSQVPFIALSPSAGLSWSPTESFTLRVGWKGFFLNTSPFFPSSTFTLNAELANPSTRYGGGLTGRWDLYPNGVQLPDMGLSGFVRVSEGVMFTLSGDDLLSPLIPGGRTLWSNIVSGFPGYYDPGLRVTLATHISL